MLSPSCIIQSKAQHSCASLSESQVFLPRLARGPGNFLPVKQMKHTNNEVISFFYVLVHPLVLKTKKIKFESEQMDLLAVICTTLSALKM